jgi:hypothetical protein
MDARRCGVMGPSRLSGLCAFVQETMRGQGEAMVAICRVKRAGEDQALERRFGVADAKAAGLWGKDGPWRLYPRRMLQMRARAFALRDGFADVLGGLYLAEEIEDGSTFDGTPRSEDTAASEPVAATFSLPQTPPLRRFAVARPKASMRQPLRGVAPLSVSTREKPAMARAPAADFAASWEDGTGLTGLLDDALCCAQDEETLSEILGEFEDHLSAVIGRDREDAERVIDRHRRRITVQASSA